MEPKQDPSAALCAVLRQAGRTLDDSETVLGTPACTGALEGARSDWPEVSVDPAQWLAFVAERYWRAGAPDQLDGSGLYLAAACLGGDARALRYLNALVEEEANVALARFRLDPDLRSEICQAVRLKLLVAEGGGRARLGDYSGRGPLRSWLRVVLLRHALNALDAQKAARGFDDAAALGSRLGAGKSAEMDYFRRHYQEALAGSVCAAMAELSKRDRALLRLHISAGLSFDRIGRAYGVDRSTACRWVSAAREKALESTRRHLAARTGLTRGELPSLWKALASDFDVSLGRAFVST